MPPLINDPRFAPAGVLAPKSKADLAFIMHSPELAGDRRHRRHRLLPRRDVPRRRGEEDPPVPH